MGREGDVEQSPIASAARLCFFCEAELFRAKMLDMYEKRTALLLKTLNFDHEFPDVVQILNLSIYQTMQPEPDLGGADPKIWILLSQRGPAATGGSPRAR